MAGSMYARSWRVVVVVADDAGAVASQTSGLGAASAAAVRCTQANSSSIRSARTHSLTRCRTILWHLGNLYCVARSRTPWSGRRCSSLTCFVSHVLICLFLVHLFSTITSVTTLSSIAPSLFFSNLETFLFSNPTRMKWTTQYALYVY